MKILSADQIRELDAYTIIHEPILSVDLMERAAHAFVRWFIHRYPDTQRPVAVFCGVGNNGGDGLVTARLLHQHFYDVQVYWCKISAQTSEDFRHNLDRLPAHGAVPVNVLNKEAPFPPLPSTAILIDAIFGSGLNRPVTGYWAQLLNYLNGLPNLRVAIDIPSGLFADSPSTGVSFHAHRTLSFEVPKLAFFFPENNQSVGDWEVVSIGLDSGFLAQLTTPFYYLEEDMVCDLVHLRHKFDHKGTYGHALLIMGSQGTIGAAVLAARACLRSGAGLVTVHAPKCGYEILQISVPEAMVSIDRHLFQLSEIPALDRYSAIGVGCGLGQKKTTQEALVALLKDCRQPLVIDADALNLLAQLDNGLDLIPPGSILTPHPKEFERLFGKTTDEFEQNERQRQQARQRGIYIILKRAHTSIACPDGNCYFNATGNPGMATGGSGDVLTGVLTALLAQGYSPRDACLLGVYVHGLAGDLAAAELEHEGLIAGDIVRFLGKAFRQIKPVVS